MKIAVIGPNFFSYVQAVTNNFVQRGLSATFFDERHSNSIATKIFYRLGAHRYLLGRHDVYISQMVDNIIRDGYSHVLLINSEVIQRAHVDQLRGAGIDVYFFSWDSISNKPNFIKLRDAVRGMATFDMVDADRLGLCYIPLFADAVFSHRLSDCAEARDIDVSFCGTLHSNRASRLRALLRSLPAGANTVLKIFVHSRLIFAVKALGSPANFAFWKIVSEISFPRTEIADMLFRSKYVLDLPHPGQAGLTARTFEALRAGARLVTFNHQAATLPPSLRQRVVIVADPRQAGELDLGSPDLAPLSADEDYFLSIDRFVDDLLELMNLTHLRSRTLPVS